MIRRLLGSRTWSAVCIGALVGLPLLLIAQAPAPAPAQQPPAAAAPNVPKMSAEQLGDLAAPIALYPDPLISQVLAASTYPLEVVEAQQWLQKQRGLSGQALMDAARQQNWDPSVQALVAFPDTLDMLAGNAQWTTQLGDAFLSQQADVMAAVQRMRARAQASGKLFSTPQQQVTTETQGGQTAIQIMPAEPEVIYVPMYDPYYVWGPPLWGYYPALGLGYYGYGYGWWPPIDIGFWFGPWGGWGWGLGWGWGWGPNWFRHHIFVNYGFFHRYGFGLGPGVLSAAVAGTGLWEHNAAHRLGVSYPTAELAGRYQAPSMAARAAVSRQAPATGWSRFNSPSAASQAPRMAGAQNLARGPSGPGVAGNAGGWQRFQGAQGRPMPEQGYQAFGQRYQAAPQQRYQPMQPRYQAPAPQFRSAPSFGGGIRSYGGGIGSFGGGVRSFGGFGGGGIRGGGGGHVGGGRR